jgi:hypothetical protein
MEYDKLLSMIEFVKTQWKSVQNNNNVNDNDLRIKMAHDCNKYAQFLSKDLNISMFAPAIKKDGEWVILKEPKQYIGALEFAIGEDYEKAIEYREALEKVLFKGVMGVNIKTYMSVCKTVNDLTHIKKQFIPKLTEYGIKEIGI